MPAEYASRVAALAPGMMLVSCVVSSTPDAPITRAPMLIAKLSPVPRKCVGYIRGK